MPDPRIYPVVVENTGAVSVTNVSTLVLAANGRRTGLDLTNLTDPSEAISLAFGQAAVNGEGKIMTAFGSTFHMGTNNLWTGEIYAICNMGAEQEVYNLAYSEEEAKQ